MKFNIADLTVFESDTIRASLRKLESNSLGLIVVTDEAKTVKGVATDGDIRRGLLTGQTLEEKISTCYNTDCIWATQETTHERLLKILDHGIRAVPLIDKKNRLIDVITRDNIPFQENKNHYIRARAPVRVSFGGGGSDVTHYFEKKTGAVLNATISIYSHACMKIRTDQKVNITSYDLDYSINASNLDEALSTSGNLGLIQSILSIIKPDFGFDIFLNSDFSIGSGLGGSSSIAASVLGCFNMVRSNKWTKHQIAEIAFQAERLNLGVSGGWQDQYAAVFGGFNFIEFNASENNVIPLKLDNNTISELEESLILCDTGISHNSGLIHVDQKSNMKKTDISALVTENVALSYEIRTHLLKGRLGDFGNCLDRAWKFKQRFSRKISNKTLDDVYSEALLNGASGGKLLGAGGGGYFLFHVKPFQKHSLINHLKSKNLNVHPFRFESEGLRAWTFC